MFVRFITPWWEFRRGVDSGPFGPAGDCVSDREVGAALRAAIGHELDWFDANLPVPGWHAFRVKSRRCWRSDGICWFADSAREMIAHAFALAALLGECGIPVRKVATGRPGTILYRDDYQIVAKPDAATPTLWY